MSRKHELFDTLLIRSLGGVILAAALMKATESLISKTYADLFSLQHGALAVEMVAGICTVLWPGAVASRAVLVALFSIFVGVLARLIYLGNDSCNCFSLVATPPPAVVVFDAVAIAAIGARWVYRTEKRRGLVTASLCLLALAGSGVGYSFQLITESKVSQASDIAELPPHSWRGRVLPIRELLPVSPRKAIEKENSLLVVFNPNCKTCQEELRKFCNLSRTLDYREQMPQILLLPTAEMTNNEPELSDAIRGFTLLHSDLAVGIFVDRPTYINVKRGVVVNTQLEAGSALAELAQANPVSSDRSGPDWIRLAHEASPKIKARAGQPSFIKSHSANRMAGCSVGGAYAFPVWVTNEGAADAFITSATADCSCTVPFIREKVLHPAATVETVAFISPKVHGSGEVSILFAAKSENKEDFAVARIGYRTNGRFTVAPNSRVSMDSKANWRTEIRITSVSDVWKFRFVVSTIPDGAVINVSDHGAGKNRGNGPWTAVVDLSTVHSLCRRVEMGWLILERADGSGEQTALGLVFSIPEASGMDPFDEAACAVYPDSVSRMSEVGLVAKFDLPMLTGDSSVMPRIAASASGESERVSSASRSDDGKVTVTVETGTHGDRAIRFLEWKMPKGQKMLAPVILSATK